jgi:succinyl-diaminopimelate desuccinylase
MDAASLLQRLIACPSVTPQEGGALHLLREVLTKLGFKVEILTFSQEGTPDVANLYARLGNRPPYLIFAGHTDVVPPGPEDKWKFPPFAGKISKGRLYGRGAVDMKGGIAAFIAATAAYLKTKGAPKGSLGFLITGDEEGPAVNGTPKLLQWAKKKGERFDHCLLGEPSGLRQAGDRIKVGARGSYSARLTVTGKQGHVAYPQHADNPVPHLLRLAAALKKKLDKGNKWFPASNLEITDLHVGNPVSNVIPEAASLSFNVRFCDQWTLNSLEKELRARLDKAAQGMTYKLEPALGNSEAFRTKAGDFLQLVAGAAHSVTKKKPQFNTAGGTSDARFIKDYCPVVELGPAGSTLHQIDENIELDDLERAVAVYGAVLRQYFNK